MQMSTELDYQHRFGCCDGSPFVNGRLQFEMWNLRVDSEMGVEKKNETFCYNNVHLTLGTLLFFFFLSFPFLSLSFLISLTNV